MRWADLLLIGCSSAGSLFLLWTYAWGNDWKASRVGRALVLMATTVALLTGVGTWHRIQGGGEVDVFTTVELAVVLSMVLTMDIAFFKERVIVRRQLTRERLRPRDEQASV
jgi:drug/metabolite transporter (DMT)-like permease